jgi:hypothetical protein
MTKQTKNDDFHLDLRKFELKHETNPFLLLTDTDTGEEKEILAPHFKSKREFWNTNKSFGIAQLKPDGEVEVGDDVMCFMEKKVYDDDEFIKVYVKNLGKWDGLSNTAQRVFHNILPFLKPNKDEMYLDYRQIQKGCGYTSKQQVWKGIKELVLHEFIAPSTRTGWWWINPLIAFNGNRQVLVTTIERKRYRAVKRIGKFNKQTDGGGE